MSRTETLDSVQQRLREVSLRCCCGWSIVVGNGRLPDPNVASLLLAGHLEARHPGSEGFDLAVVLTPVYPAVVRSLR